MKRKISLFLLAVTLLTSILTFSACGKSDVPSGMQLVAGGKSEGYYFYAPEEWTVSNLGDIKSAYVSGLIDTTSVSFCEIDLTKLIPEGIDKSEYFFNSYFNDNLSEFPAGSELEVTLNGENALFGKEKEDADKAMKYTYNYKYNNQKYGFIQILCEKSGRFFVFTYCSIMEERSGGKTYYDYHLEQYESVIDNFRFTEITEEKEKTEYKKDSDGYLLVTDKDLAGFSLYVPETFIPDYASAVVSATHEDGSNISMSETMTNANVNITEYYNQRKEELSAFVTEFTEIPVEGENNSYLYNGGAVDFGNANAAWRYEYTFVYNGEKYHVCQIYAIEGPTLMPEGYVFTYTAKEANYALHTEEIQKVIDKVNFK